MKHLHKRFSVDQIKIMLSSYLKRRMSRQEVEKEIGIGKTRFFSLLKKYKKDPSAFSIRYQRSTPDRLQSEAEKAIVQELQLDKNLIDNPQVPILFYNYSAIRDRLDKKGVSVSLWSIIDRAKTLGFYQSKKARVIHDREVTTTAIGSLIQHDASLHLWSPYANCKWSLITSLDDFSRMILYADFVEKETTWAHIQAAQSLMENYGIPLRYYVDQLRVFRFIQNRDSIWRKHILGTDDIDPQWRQVIRIIGVDVIYALSPQAKGKIERPYRWLQDRIVRTCAIEHVTQINQAREVLKEEVKRYNEKQVHSTTKEIPFIRFDKARKAGNSLFRKFTLPKPYSNSKDVFALREKRMVNGYHKISLWSKEIFVPKAPLRDYVEICIIPDTKRGVVEFRFWWNNQLVHTLIYQIRDFSSVHF